MSRFSAIAVLCLLAWALPASSLELTPEEQAWLTAHPELRLGVDNSWPPFEFIDDEQHYQGLAADYVALIEQRLPIKLNVAPPPPAQLERSTRRRQKRPSPPTTEHHYHTCTPVKQRGKLSRFPG